MNSQTLLNYSSMAVLLIVSSVLASMGKTTEMGLAICAGSIGLAFANLDKFKKFSGAGFTAELKEKIEAVIEKETELVEPESSGDTMEAYGLVGNPNLIVRALKNTIYT